LYHKDTLVDLRLKRKS